MDPTAAAIVLTLFPTSDHREWGVGPYAFDSDEAPLIVEGLPTQNVQALELMTRQIYDTQEASEGDLNGTGQGMRLRMYSTTQGLKLDHFDMRTLLLNVRVRPNLGDTWDVAFPGSWDRLWTFGDTGRMQWRIYSPMSVHILGVSKSDMDGDDRARYYAGLGGGLGGEVLARVAGPVGVQASADFEAMTRRRRNPNPAHFTTRHELVANAELGVSFIRDKQAWVLGAWGEHITQYEPWDEGGRDGIDRQYFALGARLSARFYKEQEINLPLEGSKELEALLESLENVDEMRRGKGLFESEDEPVEDGVVDVEPAPKQPESYRPMEVHWSEVGVTTMVEPDWPADTPQDTVCVVEFFVDTTGVPYDVRPGACPPELLPNAMTAAWSWRFSPIVDGGDTVSAWFAYRISRDQMRSLELPSPEAPPED